MGVVTKVLVWAGEVIDMVAEVAAGILASVIIGVLADVTVTVCAAVVTALVEFEELSWCWAEFDRWPLAALKCDRVLQACMPSYHV